MRALYVPHFPLADQFEYSGESCHHLIHVLRVQPGQSLKLIDGSGCYAMAKVIQVLRNSILLQVADEKMKDLAPTNITLAVGLVKRPAQEEIIKKAVELGIRQLCFFQADFSNGQELKPQRIDSLIQSAMEQSNHTHYLKVEYLSSLELLLRQVEGNLCYGSMKETSQLPKLAMQDQITLVVGPEGGLSMPEEQFLSKLGAHGIALKTPILRAETAVVTLVGFFHGFCAIS